MIDAGEFNEEWFCENSCIALESFAKQTSHLTGRVVEIGCWEGRSTVALANAIAPTYIDAVDTWKGSPGEISAELAAERDVFLTFKANIAQLTDGNVYPYRMGWRSYACLSSAPIRLLHIDAEHTFTEVHDAIETFLPLMQPGGILCGDDNHHPPVMEAVHSFFPQVQTWASEWWVRIGDSDG